MAATSRYVKQLRETARLVAEAVGRPTGEWDLVFQSRSGPPAVPWLEPDINDHLRALHLEGTDDVVLVPIGFISDHIEVVYDLDTQARDTAAALGMRLVRAATVGTDERFVAMIRELVLERIDPGVVPQALGGLGPWHDVCPVDCCPAPARPAASRPGSASAG